MMPGEIIWQGYEVGRAIITGAALKQTPKNNPVRRAYEPRPFGKGKAIDHGKPSNRRVRCNAPNQACVQKVRYDAPYCLGFELIIAFQYASSRLFRLRQIAVFEQNECEQDCRDAVGDAVQRSQSQIDRRYDGTGNDVSRHIKGI